MSLPVPLAELHDALAEHTYAYLLTASTTGGPHVVAVSPELEGAALLVPDVGRRTASNATASPAVTVVWPPRTDGGYSLIVDGEAVVDGDRITVTPRRAVQHRPAPGPRRESPGCTADCVELPVTTATD